MEISFVQCLLIGLWTAVCMAGNLLGIYTNRSLVMATGVGIILGDPITGLAMGAVGELAFMGYGVSQGTLFRQVNDGELDKDVLYWGRIADSSAPERIGAYRLVV